MRWDSTGPPTLLMRVGVWVTKLLCRAIWIRLCFTLHLHALSRKLKPSCLVLARAMATSSTWVMVFIKTCRQKTLASLWGSTQTLASLPPVRQQGNRMIDIRVLREEQRDLAANIVLQDADDFQPPQFIAGADVGFE